MSTIWSVYLTKTQIDFLYVKTGFDVIPANTNGLLYEFHFTPEEIQTYMNTIVKLEPTANFIQNDVYTLYHCFVAGYSSYEQHLGIA